MREAEVWCFFLWYRVLCDGMVWYCDMVCHWYGSVIWYSMVWYGNVSGFGTEWGGDSCPALPALMSHVKLFKCYKVSHGDPTRCYKVAQFVQRDEN